MNASANNALSVTNIAFNFGPKTVLDDVNIRVDNGKFVALLGANGAGKTTLFSIITGLYAAHKGSVSIGGHDLRKNTRAALSSIGVVFQRPTLDRDLSVTQNLKYFCALQGITGRDATQRISKSLAQYGLQDMGKRKVTQLSGGQQRRVELARSLLHDPKLLLLDEPTVGLDHSNRIDFVKNVKNLSAENNTGVLWATHLMDEVEDADYVYIVDQGKVIFEGESSQLQEVHGQSSVAELFNHLTRAAEDKRYPAAGGNKPMEKP